MMPRKIVARRDASRCARCTQIMGNWLVGYACDAPMKLVITKSPLTSQPYIELVVTRCLAGHVVSAEGVLIND